MKLESFDGQVLRERRTAMGLRPEDVYLRTRIPQAYIEHLEMADLEALPAPCYTAGFLRSYCTFLGLDADPFLRAYRASVRPPQRILFRHGIAIPSPRLRMKGLSDMLTWAAVCAMIALAWFAYSVVVQPHDDMTENKVEATTNHMVVPPAPQWPDHPRD